MRSILQLRRKNSKLRDGGDDDGVLLPCCYWRAKERQESNWSSACPTNSADDPSGDPIPIEANTKTKLYVKI
jgi:hypothetical protein